METTEEYIYDFDFPIKKLHNEFTRLFQSVLDQLEAHPMLVMQEHFKFNIEIQTNIETKLWEEYLKLEQERFDVLWKKRFVDKTTSEEEDFELEWRSARIDKLKQKLSRRQPC